VHANPPLTEELRHQVRRREQGSITGCRGSRRSHGERYTNPAAADSPERHRVGHSRVGDVHDRAINWPDTPRFYVSKAEWDRVNAALDRIRSEPMDVGEIMIHWNDFTPDPGLDDSYFFPEASAGGASA
jgi:hypothetical protein